MSHIYWMTELRINEGHEAQFRTVMDALIASSADEPGTLAYEWNFSEDGRACVTYERFADSASALAHLSGFGRHAEAFLHAVTPTSFRVFGPASEELKAAIAGFEPTYFPDRLGFSR